MANTVKAHVLGDDDSGLDAAGRSKQLPEDTWDYDLSACGHAQAGKPGANGPFYNQDPLDYLRKMIKIDYG